MNASLPEGFIVRPVVMEDAATVAELYNAMERLKNRMGGLEEEELRTDWGAESFNLETDSLLVSSPEGLPVGHAEFWDQRPPHVRFFAFTAVIPEYMQRGIGAFLAQWVEERARKNVEKAPGDARVTLQQYISSSYTAAIDLLSRRGYQHIRDSHRMQIDFDQPPVEPVIPEGIEIRSICGTEEERLAMFACYESFLDHWGSVDEPFESYYKRWKYYTDNDSNRDPSLWFIAMEGAEIAGASICSGKIEDDPEMGWVGTLGVRRPWRKRGLGLALLRHSFREFYRRGKPRAGLGVDASSLTGATRLYERAGMHVERTTHIYELILRGGKDYTRQSIEQE